MEATRLTICGKPLKANQDGLVSLTQLAALAGVPEADAQAWSEDVPRWVQRGYAVEDAIARQSGVVDRLTFWARRLDPREIRATAQREVA